jgi:hypothetical protein
LETTKKENIIILFYIAIFFFLIKKLPFFNCKHISKNFIIFILLIKFTIGLLLYWLYSKYYTNRFDADIFKFYDDSQVIYNSIFENPLDFIKLIFSYKIDTDYFFSNYLINMNNWDSQYNSTFFNDSHTIIKINALLRIISYHVHTLFFCMMSTIGLFSLYKSIIHLFEGKENILKWLLFFTPSVLLWSSGVLKEPIILLLIGVIFLSIHKILKNHKTAYNILILTSSLSILFFIKFYIFIAFLSIIIPFLIIRTSSIKKILIIYTSCLFIFFGLAISLKQIYIKFDFINILINKQKSFIRMSQ